MIQHAGISRRMLGCTLACAMLAGPAATPADVKPRTSAGVPSRPSHDDMTADMKKLALPGPPHEMLRRMAGSWKAVTKVWTGPGEPQVSRGLSEKTMILGGRFLKEEFNGLFMGSPFSGLGISGYDMTLKEYVASWTDTVGTGLMTMKGEVDATGNMITWKAIGTNPATREEQAFRMTTRIVDDNAHVFSFLDNVDGREVTTYEITYTRQ